MKVIAQEVMNNFLGGLEESLFFSIHTDDSTVKDAAEEAEVDEKTAILQPWLSIDAGW